MSHKEHEFARLIKLCCLVIIALAVVYMAMDRLEAIMIPFFLALALSYLLTPLIECLSCGGRVPRALAVLASFMVANLVLVIVGLIVFQAMATFKARSGLYRARVEEMLERIFEAAETLRVLVDTSSVFGTNRSGHEDHDAITEATEIVSAFLKDISITNAIIALLGTAAKVAEDIMYIILVSCVPAALAATGQDSSLGPMCDRLPTPFAHVLSSSSSCSCIHLRAASSTRSPLGSIGRSSCTSAERRPYAASWALAMPPFFGLSALSCGSHLASLPFSSILYACPQSRGPQPPLVHFASAAHLDPPSLADPERGRLWRNAAADAADQP